MSNLVILDVNWKLYSQEQRDMIEGDFQRLDFEVRPPDTARFSGELANAIMLVVAEESVRGSLHYAFERLHDLKEMLARTIFRPRSGPADTAIEIKTSESTATLIVRDEYGIDAAYALLEDLEAALEAHGHAHNLSLLYRDGQWSVRTRADGASYQFDPSQKALIKVDPAQAIAAVTGEG